MDNATTISIPTGIRSTFPLRDGNELPCFGLGVFELAHGDATSRAVRWALEEGYPLVDTAACYHNEADVGAAIAASGAGAYVVTKVWNDAHGLETCLRAVFASLRRLRRPAIDLVLMHSPIGGDVIEAWDALLEARRRGWARSVGASNFSITHLQALLDAGRPLPVVNQIECHCFRQQRALRAWCQEHGVVVVAYAPLAKSSRLENGTLQAVAAKHGKTVPQVMLRWVLQQGMAAIPKSSRHERISENLRIFDFELEDADMCAIASLDEDMRTCWEDKDPLMAPLRPGYVEATCTMCRAAGYTADMPAAGRLVFSDTGWLCAPCFAASESGACEPECKRLRRANVPTAAWTPAGSELPWYGGHIPADMLKRIAASLAAACPSAQLDREVWRQSPAQSLDRDVRKGEILLDQAPRLMVQTAASRKRCFLCGHCGVPCGTPSQQLSLARGQRRRAAVEHPAHCLPELGTSSSSSCWPCPAAGCDEVFCGELCRQAACEHGAHRALCGGGGNPRELRRHAQFNGEALLLATTLVVEAARAHWSSPSGALCEQLELLEALLSAAHRPEEPPEDVEENRLLLRLVLVHDLGWLNKEFLDNGSAVTANGTFECNSGSRILADALSARGYGLLVYQMENLPLRLELPSPLANYCQQLLEAPREALAPALSALEPFVREAVADDGSGHEEDRKKEGAVDTTLERHAARLAQAAEATLWGGKNPFANAGGTVMALVSLFEHSCVPSTTLDVVADRTGGLRGQLVATRALAKGETPTVAHVATDAHVAERERALHARFGEDFVCECFRCKYERATDASAAMLMAEELRTLAEQATQSAQHDEAFKHYGDVLRLLPNDGDAWFGRGTALYESGRWADGSAMFEEGALKAPKHPKLQWEAAKIKAYRFQPLSGDHVRTVARPAWDAYLHDRCFVTKEQPIVSQSECEQVIASAEAFAAAQGGWTTVRHYAVPTTDLNIHEVPALHAWFMPLVRNKLAPLLAAQFGTEEMGEGGANIRVGDAFLVKYATAGGSKHIPVHRDYSTHSLTIALNPSSEYDGGGTYFCDLGRSLRPELGHVVSFSGDLVHGGDPITRGVRYIVATFLYVDKGAGGPADSTAVAAKSGSVDLGWLRPMLRTKGVASAPPLVVEPGSRWDFPPILEVVDEAEAEWVAHWESSRDELREKGATEGQESRADPGATEGDSTSTGGNDDMVSADCDDLDTGSFSWLMSLGSGDE